MQLSLDRKLIWKAQNLTVFLRDVLNDLIEPGMLTNTVIITEL